ncbi:hypothetical protein [Paenibacillus xylanilyticus]
MAYIRAAVRFMGQALPAVPTVRCSLYKGNDAAELVWTLPDVSWSASYPN